MTATWMESVPLTPDSPEPEGLWAVVAHTTVDEQTTFLVKAPDWDSPEAYWFEVGDTDGWGWDQVMRRQGLVRLVRPGVEVES